MRAMKKLLVILMMVVMGVALISGCGKKTTTETKSESTNKENKEVVEITLTSWRVEEIEAFEKLNAEFEKEYPNIKVVYEPVRATEYDSQLGTSLTTGTVADMMYLRPFDLGQSIYDSGYLLELNEENIPNLKNFSDTQISIYQTDEGNIYGLPYMYVSYSWLYNKDIFDKYGLSEPETWEDFYATVDVLKENGVTPIALGTKDAWVLNEIVSAGNYGSFTDGEKWRQAMLKGESDFLDTGFVDHLRMIDNLKQYMPESYMGMGYVEAQQMFAIGDAAIHPAGSWEAQDMININPELNMGIFRSPVVKEGNTPWIGFHGGAGIGVNKNSEHLEEVLTYVNWLGSEKAQIMTGNLMPGLYPCANISFDKIENDLAREAIEFGGPNGEYYAIGWPYEGINSDPQLGASTISMEYLSRMMLGEVTPEEVANKLQEGILSWYKAK